MNRTPSTGIMLDSGGVLLFPDTDIISRYVRRHGMSLSADEILRAIACADREADTAGHGVGIEPFPVLWSRFCGIPADVGIDVWDRLNHEVPDTVLWSSVNTEALAFLTRLPRHVPRYVVSNSNGSAYQEIVNAGLASYIDGVLDSRVIGIEKPDLRIYRMAAAAMGLELDQCVYVGDTQSQIPAASVPAVLYDRYGVRSPEKYRWPLIRSLLDLSVSAAHEDQKTL